MKITMVRGLFPPNTQSWSIPTYPHTHHVQELNVRELSLATKDSQYGVRLQGEPDNERLGKRLKGDFKKVRSWLSHLANAMVEIGTFQNPPIFGQYL